MHPDRTQMFFRLQRQSNRKLIPCFGEVFSHPIDMAIPTSPFFHLQVIGFCVIYLKMCTKNCNLAN